MSDPRASTHHAQHVGSLPEKAQPDRQPCASCCTGVPGGMPDSRASGERVKHAESLSEEAQPDRQTCASCCTGVPGGMPDSRASGERVKHAESSPEEAQPDRQPCASCSACVLGGIPRRHAGELTYDDFVLQYMATNQPVMIQVGLHTMTVLIDTFLVKSRLASHANFLCYGAVEQSCWLWCIRWLTCPP